MADGIEDEGELGPAMQALSPRHRAFVLAYVTLARNGIENNAEAARQAGYSDHMERCKVTGHTLSHDPRIQAALLEESRKKINLAASVVATPVTIEIALDVTLSARDRLRACEMLFNRGGMPAVSEQKITVEHKQPKQMVDLARRLALELGVDAARLIGVNRAAAPILDGEYTEVSDGKLLG